MKVNNWLKRQIAALSISFSNVEKNLLNQEGKPLDDGTRQQTRHLQGTLADSLVHGEVTQEVKNLRWRTYKILKRTEDTTLEVEKIDEHGNVYYKTKKKHSELGLKSVKLDKYDDYELEMVFNNDEITISGSDAISDNIKLYDEPITGITKNGMLFTSHGEINAKEYFATNKTDKPLNIVREIIPKFYIENYVKKINVRKINDNERLLEFYVNKYVDIYNKNSSLFINEIKKTFDLPNKKFNFLDIDEINFITNHTLGADDFLYYSYGNLVFDKIIEFDGYYVIKFKGTVLVDGEDILSKYVENELEIKYQNKERKK